MTGQSAFAGAAWAECSRSSSRELPARLAWTSHVWETPVVLKRWFHRTVLSRRWLTFLVMGLAFFAFGAGTFNIFMLFRANADLIANYGWQALMDGAARQFAELVVTGYLSMAAYIVFKACEHRLAHELSDPADAKPTSKPKKSS
jgi:hypothetical protein